MMKCIMAAIDRIAAFNNEKTQTVQSAMKDPVSQNVKQFGKQKIIDHIYDQQNKAINKYNKTANDKN